MAGKVLRRIALEGYEGTWFSASTWIDASYEGDMLDRVATMTWGRESVTQYGETHAGRQNPQSIGAVVNPYWDASAVEPQVIPHVLADVPVDVGQADRWIQPYDFRLCMTDSPGNRIPITKPPGYNSSEWELWRRIYAANPPKSLAQAGLDCLGPIPNNYSDCGSKPCRKCDMLGMNHGTDMTNGAWGYPNGSTHERRSIWRAHVEFTRGLLWFWSNDSAVPASVRDEIAQLGHCSDEYDSDSDPPHWPHQLYVREAKRLVGDFVWTEHRAPQSLIERSIGLGSYSFDCHVVSRIIQRSGNIKQHHVVQEGRVDVHAEQPAPSHSRLPGPESRNVIMPPFEIPYDVLLPKATEVANVLAAVAISSSHVRYNAIRMEPTWMIIGHAAGCAAAIAARTHMNVHDLNVSALQHLLLSQGQKLVP